MLYPVYVHVGDNDCAHGATIPDFPGCFSAADNWEDLPGRVQEAIEAYCQGQGEGEDIEIPRPSDISRLRDHQDYQGGEWVFVDVNTDAINTQKVRINLSIPQYALSEIDNYIGSHGGNRSRFMVESALKAARAAEAEHA